MYTSGTGNCAAILTKTKFDDGIEAGAEHTNIALASCKPFHIVCHLRSPKDPSHHILPKRKPLNLNQQLPPESTLPVIQLHLSIIQAHLRHLFVLRSVGRHSHPGVDLQLAIF